MPELPEVETVMRGLMPAMINKTVHDVTINRHDLRGGVPHDFAAVMRGENIQHFIRRGKYILGFGQSGQGFVLHLGMSGRIRIYAPPQKPTIQKHDHAVFTMADGTVIVFNDPRRFGMLYLTHENTWQDEKPFCAMGLEPLSDDFSGAVLHERLSGKKVAIKQALLNQDIVVGVGNIYACEALFDSGISPFCAAGDLTAAQCDRLAGAIGDVLTRAIESGGSTLRDYAKTDGSLGYFQHSFHVYDRAGTSCPGCSCDIIKTSGIKRVAQGGRSTFYCPQVQKQERQDTMKMKIQVLLAAVFIGMASFAPAPFAVAQAQPENVAFFQAIADLPLMSGLTEAADMTLVYDKPEGRVVEVVALGRNTAAAAVKAYYHQALPQMGWALNPESGHFLRGSEEMSLSIEDSDGLLVLRINITPRA